MTFTTQVISTQDPLNSTVSVGVPTWSGVYVSTNGYNSITVQVTDIQLDSQPAGLEVIFGSTDDEKTYTQIFRDTVSYVEGATESAPFVKNYPVIDGYYRVRYTPSISSNFTINTRLLTTVHQNAENTVTAFDNNVQYTEDAFARFRVSAPTTLLDIKIPSTSGPTGAAPTDVYKLNTQQLIDLTVPGPAGGTATVTNENGFLQFECTGDVVYTNQSRQYAVYQPGKSQLILLTGIIQPDGASLADQKGRIGYYDDYNGVYFECDGTGECSVRMKNNGSVLPPIPQAEWNIDSMDGTGNSGIKIDWTKANLFVIDAEWLGVGRVRFGIFIFGRIYYVHEVPNLNNLLGPYTSTFSLPVRYQLVNTTNLQTISMARICSTVISEGGYNPSGRTFAVWGSNNMPAAGAKVPILAIRGNRAVNYYHQTIFPNSVSLFSTANAKYFQYFIYFYQATSAASQVTFTTAGTASWNPVSPYSVTEYATFDPASRVDTTNGILITTDFLTSRTSSSFLDLSGIVNQFRYLTSNVDNYSDVYVVAITELGDTGATCYASLEWQELY